MAARNARMIFINECLSPLPFFGNLPADIKAEQTVTLLNLLFLKVEFTYAETVSQGDPPAGETRSVYTVSDGSFDAGLEAQIGQAAIEAGLSMDKRNSVLSAMHNMAVSVGNGTFSVGVSIESAFTNLKLSYTASSQEVPISSGGTTQVSATVTYSFRIGKSNLPGDSALSPEKAQELINTFETQVTLYPTLVLGAAGLSIPFLMLIEMGASSLAALLALGVGALAAAVGVFLQLIINFFRTLQPAIT